MEEYIVKDGKRLRLGYTTGSCAAAAAKAAAFMLLTGVEKERVSITTPKGAALERNLEIVDAVDDLLGYYKKLGLYETYREQLEYVAFYNLFLTASVRVCLGDAKSSLLPRLRQAFLERVPDCAQSAWYRALPKKHLLLTRLLLAGHYRAVAALMRLNAKSKA